MTNFHLVRKEDVSGVSGVGTVAEGTVFHDGQCVVSWFGQFHSVEVWPSMQQMINVHGHGDKTVVKLIAVEHLA